MAVAGSLTYKTDIDKNGFEKGLNSLKTAGKTSLGTIENATKKLNDELGKTQKEEEKAGQSTLKLGDLIKANLISDAIKSGLSALASGISKIGSSLVSAGKSAIESYANYEQLIGGVETLFKESAGIVENYANNAYKTAGLSANEYMETVTSFSASLLKSLGNDTEKSAKYADQAIIDMSDNANKMGTSMESIQYAYQGFAKQNYTMLDNLKLGYGGTKTEMERLISDANKVKKANGEMADLSIESFADVTEAIHIIQTEMGITGTTAKEASTTISGSVSSMKSAWQNLLTGIADDNADFDGLVNNFVESLITAYTNLQPRIVTAVTGLINLVITSASDLFPSILQMVDEILTSILSTIQENLPSLLSSAGEMINTLVAGISNAIPQLIPMAMQIITTLINALLENLPQILQMGITVIVELVKGIAQSLPELIPTIIDAVLLMVETLIDNIDLIIDAGIQLILGLAEGLIEALPRLIDKIPVIIEKLINAIINNLPKIIEMGITLVVKLAEGLIKAIPQLIAKLPEIFSAIGKTLGEMDWSSIGSQLLQGILNGLVSIGTSFWNAIKQLGSNIMSGIKSFFGIQSPSKLMRDEVGKFIPQGIAVGIEADTDSALKAIDNMNDDIMSEMNNAVAVETGVINAKASVKSNNSMVNVIQATFYIDGSVDIDGQKAGRIMTPYMTKTLRTGGA